MSTQAGSDIPVRVAIRCRPLCRKERREGCQSCIEFVDNQPQLILGGSHPFTYDYVFSPTVGQTQIYEDCIRPLIGNIFKGYNATILAYGQTGSGKTYTMGTTSSQYASDADDGDKFFGIIPRAIADIFREIAANDNETCHIKVSFLEIYKEDVLDLLNPSGRKEEVAIREDKDGVKVTGLYEVPVADTRQAMTCLEQGSQSRSTGATAMNATSSRSHAIFTVSIQKNIDTDMITAKLHFVDLAGSERVKKTKAEGDRFKEGVNINLGLLTLGNVISALSEGRHSHVPYREAKLTRLLQDSLGGNSHTVMVACVSPADINFEETLNTLRYAQRARKIQNKPIINRDPHVAEMARMKQLVQQLQMQLLQQQSGQSSVTESVAAIEAKALAIECRRLAEANEKLTSELQNAIDQTTILYEKAFLAEMARDKMKIKLEELRVKTGLISDSFNSSVDFPNESHRKLHMEKFEELKEKILEIQTDHQNVQENLSKCNLEVGLEDDDCGGIEDAENVPVNIDNNNEISSEMTLRQAKMNRELQEINKLLSKKEELASRLIRSDERIDTMKQSYEVIMQGFESDIAGLQKEKEELHQALRAAKANVAHNKVSEQRRKRLQELEGEIGQLRKKIVEYAKMTKLKEQSDQKVTRLNEEIQELKQARVRLVRQMRSEAERLRVWKLQKEKEVCKLRQKDQRRQVELIKKEQQFSKQQNVMRIKMEEAVSANKRLKDALQKQKLCADQRKQERERTAMLKSRNTTGMEVVKPRIVEWITQEFDLVVSALEARYHLDSLLNDRGLISAQLNKLKSKEGSLSAGSDSSSSAVPSEMDERIQQLTNELELRNVQILDLQQKLLDVDQDVKVANKFDTLQTMNEAKCALRWIFDTAVTNKVELAVKNSNIQEKVNDYQEAVQTIDAIRSQLSQVTRNYEEKLLNLKEEQEERVLYLLTQMPKAQSQQESLTDAETHENLNKRLEFQEAEIKELSKLRENMEKSKEYIKKLEADVLEFKLQGSIPKPASKEFAVPVPAVARKRASTVPKKDHSQRKSLADFYAEFSDSEEVDDPDHDPDWRKTPLMKRIQKMRSNFKMQSKINIGLDLDSEEDNKDFEPPKTKQKRPSEPRCTCKGDCSTRMCRCTKAGQKCTENCGCSSCKNRGSGDSPSEDSSRSTTSYGTSDNSNSVIFL